MCSKGFVAGSGFRGLFDANGCWAVSNRSLNAQPLGRIVITEPQLTGVKRHPPADYHWAWWPLLSLYLYGRRRTVFSELISGQQIQRGPLGGLEPLVSGWSVDYGDQIL